MNLNDSSDDPSITPPGQVFLSRVRRSAASVLGESEAGREVIELCDQHNEARRMILDDRSRGLTVIAVVGATGQGKSWLIRQMIRGSSAASAVRSGNNLDEATEKLVWIGPFPPADMDTRHETFLQCPAAEMESIGMPYLLVDAPGLTDERRAIAAVAQRALSLASVLLMVVRRDQLRSKTVSLTTAASEGTIVIPVVNAVRSRENDNTLGADIEAFVAHMRSIAPTSKIAPAVVVEDFDVSSGSGENGGGEEAVGKEAARKIAESLQLEIGSSWEGDRRRSTRLSAIDARFRWALHATLVDHLPDLTGAVTRLNREAKALPTEVAESLVGNSSSLRAAVRSRLRLNLLTETAGFWFPYRTQLGLLNLTHGAWDRVLMTLSGSLPSLVGAVWTSAKNLTTDRDASDDIRDGLRRRSAAAVADRLGPLAVNFRHELSKLRHEKQDVSTSLTDRDVTGEVASLAGIDTLQEKSEQIFEEEVNRISFSSTTAMVCGMIGTAIFWLLMSGPVIALYRGYFDASFLTLRDFAGDLDKFPKPDFAMMLTSLILSILPTALFAMAVLSWSQSRRRVQDAEEVIRQRHRETIDRLQKEGVLRLHWDEPLLADAEFLLSAGASDEGESA
ncbi:hypothetical protein LF1_12970 [Rubripirellula obstinata]|uniref:Uncharacterized protein n=1 Tax=Rubripirellula obstinata TaxID=406547 RepID=A0A5B1CHP7_9BACT|nr:GTPase [Rubripirellula obstinata]KAA1258774.1 hypothetical protein LF1_12970 [Rubripirellula obstinata]